MTTGEEILKRIQRRMEKLQLTENAVGQRAGSRDIVRSIRRGIERGIQTSVSARTIERLAPALETSPQWLLTEEGPEEVRPGAEPSDGRAFDTRAPIVMMAPGQQDVRLAEGMRAPNPATMPRDVPVLGTALGSVFDNQEGFQIEGGVIDYARRPPALAHIKDLYALYIVNDSMWPMHPAGEILFVNPHKPPVIGGSVVVQTRAHENDPGQAYIKLLRRRSLHKLTLEQFNPPLTIEIPMQFVRSVHHVYTMNELFGV